MNLPVAWKLNFKAIGRQQPSVLYTTSCNTQSSAPEDGRVQLPKHIELIGFINKPLLLRLVGVYITYINNARSNKCQIPLSLNTLSESYRLL
jgi:hypothetical protein